MDVVSIATRKTEDHQQPATRWRLADLAATVLNEAHAEAISRATIWRILNDADLKPHRSVYWLNSHDPDFEAKARQICQLYVEAPRFSQQGRLVLCCDEKPGMQFLQRKAPTQLIQPGKPAQREYEYTRLGTRALIATFAVPTGEVVWDLGPTRTNSDFLTHVLRVVHHYPGFQRFDWVVDNLNTHSSLSLCQVMAYLNGVPFVAQDLHTLAQRRAFLSNPEHKHVFHYLPKQGSWLNQIELWFSVLSRRFLRQGDFTSVADFERRLRAYVDEYNLDQVHPYRWTYTGEPLVRATPFSQTRRQQRQGRAWFGRQPSQFERLLSPPRPYQRRAKPLTANL